MSLEQNRPSDLITWMAWIKCSCQVLSCPYLGRHGPGCHGPRDGDHGLAASVDGNKRGIRTWERHRRNCTESGCSRSSLSRPLPLRWLLSTSSDILRWPLSTSGVILSSRSGDLRQQRGITLGIRFIDPRQRFRGRSFGCSIPSPRHLSSPPRRPSWS
jgi:hypothetical protein